jgi:hypothetical protein
MHEIKIPCDCNVMPAKAVTRIDGRKKAQRTKKQF